MSEYDPGLHFAKEYADKWLNEHAEFLALLWHFMNVHDYRDARDIIRDAIRDAFLAGIKNIMNEIQWEEVKAGGGV